MMLKNAWCRPQSPWNENQISLMSIRRGSHAISANISSACDNHHGQVPCCTDFQSVDASRLYSFGCKAHIYILIVVLFLFIAQPDFRSQWPTVHQVTQWVKNLADFARHYLLSDVNMGMYDILHLYMSRNMKKPTKWVCTKRRIRSAWASAQSDQSLRCALSG